MSNVQRYRLVLEFGEFFGSDVQCAEVAEDDSILAVFDLPAQQNRFDIGRADGFTVIDRILLVLNVRKTSCTTSSAALTLFNSPAAIRTRSSLYFS